MKEELKIKDVMVGDWIDVRNEASPNTPHLERITPSHFLRNEHWYGVELVPRILEKNGFEKLEEKYYRRFLEEKGYYESVRVYFDEEPNVAVRVLDGSEFKGRIKYIHELQQAMRLCHIKEKEIEL